MELIVLKSNNGDWEGLYANGQLVEEGHKLGEGTPIDFWAKILREYNAYLEQVKFLYITDDDDDLLARRGSFPKEMSQLLGVYA